MDVELYANMLQGIIETYLKRKSAHSDSTKQLPSVRSILNIRELYDLLKNCPFQEAFSFTLIDKNKNIIFETGGKEIKRLLQRKSNAIKIQREALHEILKRNEEEHITEYTCRNQLSHIGIAIPYRDKLIGSFVFGDFIFSNASHTEAIKDWLEQNRLSPEKPSIDFDKIPILNKNRIAEFKKYFFHLLSLSLAAKSTRAEISESHLEALLTTYEKATSNLFYESLFDALDAGIILADEQQNIILKNKAIGTITGIQPSSLRTLNDFIALFQDEEQRQHFNDSLARCVRETSIDKAKYTLKLSPTELSYLSVTFKLFYIHHKPFFFLFIYDHTSVQNRMKKLTETKNRYDQIFASAPMGIMQYNGDNKIIDCNEAFCKIFDRNPGDLIGINCHMLFEENCSGILHDALNGKSGECKNHYISSEHHDDKKLHLNCFPIVNRTEEIVGAICIVHTV